MAATGSCDDGVVSTPAPSGALSAGPPGQSEPSGPKPTTWTIPPLDPDNGWLGGVAAALALEVGVSPALVRAGFVAVGLTGWGLLLYPLLWLWLRGRPTPLDYTPTLKGVDTNHARMGVMAIFGGLFVGLSQIPGGPGNLGLASAGALVMSGLVVLWSDSATDWQLPSELRRFGGGMGLIGAGVTLAVVMLLDGRSIGVAFLVVLLILTFFTAMLGPWLWRAGTELNEERLRRIRADERAAVAAHLHDSVLQTLTLIQRNATDPATTTRLARRQERELREWLYSAGSSSVTNEYLRGALAGIASEIEELHGVPIEVVAVGDCRVDHAGEALLKAAREAMANASRHSGADQIDVFAEVANGKLTVFVRDQGKGFDPDVVPDDRRGLADSIHGRLARVDGTAVVTSHPGEGTEVELSTTYVDPVQSSAGAENQ